MAINTFTEVHLHIKNKCNKIRIMLKNSPPSTWRVGAVWQGRGRGVPAGGGGWQEPSGGVGGMNLIQLLSFAALQTHVAQHNIFIGFKE